MTIDIHGGKETIVPHLFEVECPPEKRKVLEARITRDRYVDSPVIEIVNARVHNPVGGNESNKKKRHDKGYWKHSAA